MDTGRTDILSRHLVPRHRLTLDEFHRLGEAGILGEGDRVELLEGQLVDMSPIGPQRARRRCADRVAGRRSRWGGRGRLKIRSSWTTRRNHNRTSSWSGDPGAATRPAPGARRHLPGDRGGGHKPGDRSRGQAGTVCQGWHSRVLDRGPDDGWRACRPKSGRRQVWVDDEGRALGHPGCGRSARVEDTGSFAVRVGSRQSALLPSAGSSWPRVAHRLELKQSVYRTVSLAARRLASRTVSLECSMRRSLAGNDVALASGGDPPPSTHALHRFVSPSSHGIDPQDRDPFRGDIAADGEIESSGMWRASRAEMGVCKYNGNG